MKWIGLCVMWIALTASAAFAQDKLRVEVSITASSGGSIYIDKGRIDGLETGDRITFSPNSGLTVEGTIRAIAKNSARVDLDPGSSSVAVGDRGEVLVPKERIDPPVAVPPTPTPTPVPTTQPSITVPSAKAPAQEPPPAVKPIVEHPEWTHPPEEWQKDKPLLAPAFGLRPEERERRIRGRAWLQSQYTSDSENGSRSYSNSSAGVDATMENPFGRGGELRFGAAAWTRSFDAEEDSDTQSRFRLNRLSYTVGGTVDDPARLNLGRFLQSGLPEFGLLDGAEWTNRLNRGDEFGVSFGAMPVPNSALTSFDDFQAAAFYRRALDEERKNTVALGYQNTWHDGNEDRNLLLAETRFEPGRAVSVRSTAWVDIYGAEDEIKGSGFELTEFLVSLSWRTSTVSGLGLTFSHRKIPELLRFEQQDFDPATIRDSTLDRIALNGWTNVSSNVRLDGRMDHWSDESDNGTAGELGAAFRDIAWDRGEIRTSLFYSSGTYSSGPGARISASKSFDRSSASLGYEYVDYEQKGFAGSQEQLAQHSLFGTFDIPVAERWDLSLIGDKRFGDNQDSWSLGFLLQTRF